MRKSHLKAAESNVKRAVAKSEAVSILKKPATDSATPIGANPSRTATGSSSSHPNIPAWATFQPTVECWWELLDEYNVDDAARHLLFALAQTNFEAANDVIHKLLKKKNDGITINNPSALIFTNVMNHRSQADSWGHKKK